MVSGELTVASAHRSKVHPTTLPLQLLVTGATTTSQNHGTTTTTTITTTNATTIDSNHSLPSVLCVRLSVSRSFYDANLMAFFSPRPTSVSRSPLHSPKSPANPASFSLPRRFSLHQNTTRLGERPYHMWKAHPHGLPGLVALMFMILLRVSSCVDQSARARAHACRLSINSGMSCGSRTYRYYVASDATFSDAKKSGSGRHYVAPHRQFRDLFCPIMERSNIHRRIYSCQILFYVW